MGAARLGQAASDAVIVTLCRSLTCAKTVTRALWPLEHCVRIEGVRGSNPLSSTQKPQVSALACGYAGLPGSALSDFGSGGVRFWEPILRSPARSGPGVA